MTFTTIRPADYPTPYEAMVKHNIQVGRWVRSQVGIGEGRAAVFCRPGPHSSDRLLVMSCAFVWLACGTTSWPPLLCRLHVQFSALDKKAGRLSTLMVRIPPPAGLLVGLHCCVLLCPPGSAGLLCCW